MTARNLIVLGVLLIAFGIERLLGYGASLIFTGVAALTGGLVMALRNLNYEERDEPHD